MRSQFKQDEGLIDLLGPFSLWLFIRDLQNNANWDEMRSSVLNLLVYFKTDNP